MRNGHGAATEVVLQVRSFISLVFKCQTTCYLPLKKLFLCNHHLKSQNTFMAHESHHPPTENRPIVSYRSAFFFGIILIVVFIAAVNFVKVMSHDTEGHGANPHHTTTNEATSGETLKDETGLGRPVTDSAREQESNVVDTSAGKGQ